MRTEELQQIAINVAKLSPCKKRKVGAIITYKGAIQSRGFNHHPKGHCCEDSKGDTLTDVIHAEAEAIRSMNAQLRVGDTIYVTHTPCGDCMRLIEENKLNLVIVEDFMKFDDNKLKYSLIPPVATRELAKVLTYGAEKYKPNNWKKVDDTSRYVDALYRHLEAWRNGENIDPESKLSHLAHAMTNIAFLLYFEN